MRQAMQESLARSIAKYQGEWTRIEAQKDGSHLVVWFDGDPQEKALIREKISAIGFNRRDVNTFCYHVLPDQRSLVERLIRDAVRDKKTITLYWQYVPVEQYTQIHTLRGGEKRNE